MDLTVVVGATGALGRAIVDRLVGDGHTILAVARGRDGLSALASRYPQRILTCVADIAEDGAVEVLSEAVGERRVTLAVLAAGAAPGEDITTVGTEVIVRAVEVKANGFLRLFRGVGANLDEGSRLVALGGSLGLDPSPAAPAAGIANAAQANIVRQLNRVVVKRGVACYVVSPGPVETERLRRMVRDEAAARGLDPEELLEERRSSVPIGRLITPEEVAWAVARLADAEAEALAGWTLLLDGGRRTAIP